ncbi:hypothetical protein ACJMK2_014180 [Sinanodonta woodiana]|uniref:Cyclic nucleotide-binding domain-containing protein n=1 Tax=Sinanodonta woodiana TaxID=1069815 RepID=A0ABD3UZU9_SINWO
MGRSCACKFLYAEDTKLEDKAKIDEALEKKEELKIDITFKKKNGDTFLCLLDIVPIKNEKNQVVLLLVSHKNISEEGLSSSLGTQKDETNDSDENDSDGDMAEAYRQCQTRRRGEHESDDDFRYQRRRSRAVLYHLSGQFGKQNKAKSKLQQFNKLVESSSMSAKMPEYKVQEVKKSRFILVHYGIFKIGWDWMILLCTFYTAVMVPYNAAFTLQFGVFRSSIYSDVVVEIIFIFDIVLNFRTSFVNKGGQVVYQARLIAINYIKGWFGLDLLAAIPFDFLYIFNINTTAPVHLLKVARLLRLARLLQKIDRFSQYGALVLALLMSMFALVAHWLACIWYAIGNEELNTPNWTAGWIYELGERLDNPMTSNRTNKPDSLSCYLAALYFTCSSLTSVGFGNVSANTNAEKIFSVCAMIVGALMHAVVFGNVTAIIQRMYARRANFHSKTKDLKDFFHAHHLPKPLKMRMQDYFQTMWSLNNGIETNEILKDFPEEMRGEIGLHLHKEILSLSVFENAPQGCLKSISLHSRRVFCAPGEFLVHKGDATNYLYLLCSGSMEILREEMVVAILGKGDLFGTDINFDDPITVSGYDVRSLTYSELQCISLKGLVDVLGLYPEFSEMFTQELCNDLTYNLREGAEESDEDTNSNIQSRKLKLPSISEDDEKSGSDDGVSNEKDDEKEMGGDESVAHSASSPLLPNNRNTNVPNGDFDVFTRDDKSPTTTRSIHNSLRRTGSASHRKSFKEKKRLGNSGKNTVLTARRLYNFHTTQNIREQLI